MSPAPPSSTANASKRTVPPPLPQPNTQQLQLCAKQPHHTFHTHSGAEPRRPTHWHGFSYFWRLTQDFKTGTMKDTVMFLARY